MSSKTTNFNLHKIDLTDAPPDITVLNQNWDTLDTELKELNDAFDNLPGALTVDTALSSTSTNPVQNKVIYNALSGKADSSHTHDYLPMAGGVLSGALTAIDNFNVNKTFDGVEYKTYVRPINYSIGSNGDYSTGLIHYKGTLNDSQLMFNKDGVMLRDNVNGKAYQLFGQHNISTLSTALGAAKIKTGSYTGTGTEGQSNPCTLTFGFEPKFFMISLAQTDQRTNANHHVTWLPGVTRATVGNNYYCYFTQSGNSISWYGTNKGSQFNTADTKYYYIAIG